MSRAFLPYGRQCIEDDDIAAVAEVLRGDWLTTGPKVAEFEKALAARVGSKDAVVCNSGTAALHIAAIALQLGPGDKVIVPTLTFLATANAPHFTGAEIVFADVDPDTALLTPGSFEEALTRGGNAVKAVIVVHVNGQTCDMERIAEIARARGIAVIEDACHALGSTYVDSKGVRASVGDCRHSDMCCFSFHPVKTIAMGEGGAVTTNDAGFAERMRLARNHGMSRDAGQFSNREFAFDAEGRPNVWYYEMPFPAYNYRANDFQCALGLSQLAKFDRFAAERKNLMAAYDSRFGRFPDHVRPVPRSNSCDPVLHLYALGIDFAKCGKGRNTVMRELSSKGIGTQVHYLPVHLQPYYTQRYGRQKLPGSEAYYAKALSIPFFVGMTEDDVDRVIETLAETLDVSA
jgi:UDP-4-amino-4,6-dideoxy-N-acetyl-beta-L-altrosamine transaminase